MFRHLLPNAMVATMTFLPFILSSSVMTLTALDFLGFGLPPGSASLGELLKQGKANIQAPWLGFSGFFTVAGHAVAADLHRRGGARRLRSAQDVSVNDGRDRRKTARRPRPLRRLPPGRAGDARGRPHLVRHPEGRDGGAGRRVRLRQIGHRALGDEAAALSVGAASFRLDPVQGPGSAAAFGKRDPPRARQRHHHHLPGADDLAQSAAHDREADRRDPAAASGPDRRSRARAHARTA